MPGETEIGKLLGSMSPELLPGIYVFATIEHGTSIPVGIEPMMIFREREGTTLVLAEDAAKEVGLSYTFPCRMITLNVHSSLEAVGFMAAITTPLASAGIGVNPVSAYFHDHLFVPADRAKEAMSMLVDLTADNRN